MLFGGGNICKNGNLRGRVILHSLLGSWAGRCVMSPFGQVK